MDKWKKKIATVVKQHYGGDSSKVEVITVDYAVILSPFDFLKWAEVSFDLNIEIAKEADATDIINSIYDALAEHCKGNYIVIELNRKKIPSAMKEFVRNLSTALSFHFFRDYGKRIDFVA